MYYSVPYGNNILKFELPDHLQQDMISYNRGTGIHQEEIIRRALQSPHNTKPLSQLAQGKRKAVILISDISRLSPSHVFLPALTGELLEAGMSLDQIKIVVALGMHRKQTPQELRALTGDRIYEQIQVLNHSPLPEDCVYLGTTSQGTPIELLREVVEADLLIATGNIEPHRLAGMSGGIKALMPGTASRRSIEQNHALSQYVLVQPGCTDNPIRQDMEEILQFIPVHFLFNVLVNDRREILDAAAGHVVEAHRSLVEQARRRFLVPVGKKYDLTIASAGGFPKDMQLYQAVKTLQNASEITKDGGKIVLIARCQELYGNGTFQSWVETIQDPMKMEKMLKEKFVLGAHKTGHIAKILQRQQVYFYSEVPAPLAELLGFTPINDLQDCINRLSAGSDCAVMPYGALTFPASGSS